MNNDSISLCMIVKNEEKYLPYVFESVKDIVDEIIVHDTGSTDRTVEICDAYNAFVIESKWKHDFAFHRNLSTVNAKSDWILWLDGDEVFSNENKMRLKAFLSSPERNRYDFIAMKRWNFWHDLSWVFAYPDTQFKMYRNHVGLKWHGKIHEYVFDKNSTNHNKRTKYSEIHTHHYAYVKTDDEVAWKMANYIKIENPNMRDEEIKRCSREHSFFMSDTPPQCQKYLGAYPEVFNEVKVDNEGIKKVTGEVIYKYMPEEERNRKIVYVDQNAPVNKQIDKDNIYLKREIIQLKNELELLKRRKEYKSVETVTEEFKEEFVTKHRPEDEQLIEKTFNRPVNPAIKVSVVIVSNSQPVLLKNCIHSIYPRVHQPFEIIVVKNCDDENMKMVDICNELKESFSNIKLIDLKENMGFSKGYNAGVRETEGEYIVVMNDDIEVLSENFMKIGIDALNDIDRCVMIAPVSNNIRGEHQHIKELEGTSLDHCKQNYHNYIKDEVVDSSWVTGCFLMLKRETIEKLECLFDEQFVVGQEEDTDLVYRIQHRLKIQDKEGNTVGGKVFVCKNIFVYHYGSLTLNKIPDLDWIRKENKRRLIQKWPEIFPDSDPHSM